MSEWIKVSERLPEPFVSVLVYMPGEAPHPTVHEGFVNRHGAWYAGRFDRCCDEVVAWREMPEPPEAEATTAKCTTMLKKSLTSQLYTARSVERKSAVGINFVR